jgi:hypothetical protein
MHLQPSFSLESMPGVRELIFGDEVVHEQNPDLNRSIWGSFMGLIYTLAA